MANKKISALTAATTPLAGTEVLPIVQSSATVKATIANVQVAPVSSGTAYSVQFLNGSKVPTTANNFQWDGNNLGIGQYPSNPAGITTNIELPYGATIASRSNTAAPQLYIMSNALGTGYAPTYAINGYATQYQMQGFDGNHYWATAPSGTAGNAISFTNRLTLANGGDFTINTGNIIQGTAAKGITTGGSFSLGLGTNGSTSQATLATNGTLTVAGNFQTKVQTKTVASGATQNLFYVNNYNLQASGFMTVRSDSATGTTIKTYVFTILGNGIATGTVLLSGEDYGGGSATFNITETRNSPGAPQNQVAFVNTAGASVTATVTYQFISGYENVTFI